MSPLQKIQKDRAYFKFVLAGIPKPIKQESLTSIEKLLWKELLSIRTVLLNQYDNNSRLKGLNVPEHKCFCGKEGKYSVETDYFTGFMCKKHFKEQ